MIRIPVHRVPARSCKAKGRAMAMVVAYALVDDVQARLADYFWTLFTGYAVRREHGRAVFMHHDVVGRIAGREVSHENADKLDNRLANLRHVSRSENMLNEADAIRRNRTSCPFRGVSRERRSISKPWRGKVTVAGQIHQTDRFRTPEEARDALGLLRSSLRVRQWPGVA